MQKRWGNIWRVLQGLQRRQFPMYYLDEEDWGYPVSRQSLQTFQNKHQGQRCFIVGNGPSLNQTDLSKLRNEITFGVNAIFLKQPEFVPTYYVVEDRLVWEDRLAEIDAFTAPDHRFFPSVRYHQVQNKANTSFFLMNRGFYVPGSPNFEIPRFSRDASRRLYTGQTVTYLNMQLAFYMGFQDVYLIGMDFNYDIPQSAQIDETVITSTEDDPNHFDPSYFGKGKRWHDPKVDRMARSFQFAEAVFRWHDRRIWNATIGGKLEVFERVSYDDLF